MQREDFRERVVEAAGRVTERTGTNPLDLDRSMAITVDARVEQLPRSLGIGLALLAVAVTTVSIGFVLAPETGPGYPLTGVFIAIDIALALGVAVCIVLARAARMRRPINDRFEDAWARLSVEIWPPPRYQSWDGGASSGASYSRTEFLLAVREGSPLDDFERRAPITRMP